MIKERSIGINFNRNGTPTIKVWAPLARQITLEVDGKASIMLEKENPGFWQAENVDLQPKDRYKFLIDNESVFPDPASLSQPDGVHEASECIDLNEIRKISSSSWMGIPQNELILYELHVGTFTPEGTFKGVAQKLDYLKELGVNALNIMPVVSFPGNRNWGYDGAFPFSVHQSYGGAHEFALLIKACHDKGLAVVLDVVYNHLGPEGNYLGAFGPCFTAKYNTPWGNAINFDDAWCDGVRTFFLENALMWLRDFNIDGLRLDAVHAIKDFSPQHFLRELALEVKELNKQNKASHFLIAECDLNDIRYITPTEKDGGYGMNTQWCDEWHHALHALLTGETNGYYSDFGSSDQLTHSFNHAYVFTGAFSSHRKKHFGTPTKGFSGDKFVVFTQNHDHTGNRMMGERLSRLIDFESLKLAAGAMLLSPFVPLLFMGEEYAEDSPFLYFISHGDKELVRAVQEGRKKEFSAFIKDASPPDPAAEDTFLQSKLKWDYQHQDKKAIMLAFYKKLISLRKELALLKPGNRENIIARNTNDTIILTRTEGNQSLVVVMNFSSQPFGKEIPELQGSKWEVLLYSAHKKWGGNIDNTCEPIRENDKSLVPEIEKNTITLINITRP